MNYFSGAQYPTTGNETHIFKIKKVKRQKKLLNKAVCFIN
jgi:hypothetical protein